MLKQQQEEAAVRECTFHPVINHRSDRLMSERSEVLRVSATILGSGVCVGGGGSGWGALIILRVGGGEWVGRGEWVGGANHLASLSSQATQHRVGEGLT